MSVFWGNVSYFVSALLFLVITSILSRLLFGLTYSRLRLSKGEGGNPRAFRLLSAVWLKKLFRHEFFLKRDWAWVIVLALLTLALSLLPLAGTSFAEIRRPSFVFVQIFALAHAVALLGRWLLRSSGEVGVLMAQAQRSCLGISAMLMISVASSIGLGVEQLGRVAESSGELSSPLTLLTFIFGLAFLPGIRISLPRDVRGWGLERLVSALSEITWIAYLACSFTRPLFSISVEAVFLENAVKTAFLASLLAIVQVFVANVSQRSIDRSLILLLFPLVLLVGAQAMWRGVAV